MKRAGLRVHIRQLCCLGLPGEQLMPSLLKSIRELVDADSAAFFWVDARGDMTNLYAERLLPAPVRQVYFSSYYDADDSSFRRAFLGRARQADPVSALTPSAEAERSAYYNEVLRRLDAHHVLYGIVREQSQAIGQLSLYRPKSVSAFSGAQRTELTSIMRYVAHGVSRHSSTATDVKDFLDTDDDNVFFVGADGELRQISTAAQRLLALATQDTLGPQPKRDAVDDAARPTLRQLAERLQAVLASGEGPPPGVVLQSSWGRFVLRAYATSDPPLTADAVIAVRIQRQEPMLLRFVDALNGLALSPQQREVAVGLARGATNRELAEALGVSVNTVSYHVKQLFQRLDTHDRQQMVARILQSPGCPH